MQYSNKLLLTVGREREGETALQQRRLSESVIQLKANIRETLHCGQRGERRLRSAENSLAAGYSGRRCLG